MIGCFVRYFVYIKDFRQIQQKKAGYPPRIFYFRHAGKYRRKEDRGIQEKTRADLRMANRKAAQWPSAKSEDAAAAAAVVGALPLPQGDAKQWRNGQQIISSEAAPR